MVDSRKVFLDLCSLAVLLCCASPFVPDEPFRKQRRHGYHNDRGGPRAHGRWTGLVMARELDTHQKIRNGERVGPCKGRRPFIFPRNANAPVPGENCQASPKHGEDKCVWWQALDPCTRNQPRGGDQPWGGDQRFQPNCLESNSGDQYAPTH